MTKLMLNLSNLTQRRWGNPPLPDYIKRPFHPLLPMSSLFFEKDADFIYEEYQSAVEESVEQQEEEYREDRMEQMISMHGY